MAGRGRGARQNLASRHPRPGLRELPDPSRSSRRCSPGARRRGRPSRGWRAGHHVRAGRLPQDAPAASAGHQPLEPCRAASRKPRDRRDRGGRGAARRRPAGCSASSPAFVWPAYDVPAARSLPGAVRIFGITVLHWRPAPPAGTPTVQSEPAGDRWLILADGHGVGVELTRRLEAQGQRCTCIRLDQALAAEQRDELIARARRRSRLRSVGW